VIGAEFMGYSMATYLGVDERLVEAARRAGRHKTKKAAITAALEEYVKPGKQLRLLKRFGTIEYAAGHDYKTGRRSRRKGRGHPAGG